MTSYAIRYVTVLLVLVIGDAAWLSFFARTMFRPTLGDILLEDPRWVGVAIFYLLFTAGVLVFPLQLGLRGQTPLAAAMYGFLFGFFCYMTYDATNYATIKNWTAPLAFIDTLWGALLTAAATTAAYFVANRV